jgi:hypothetical protein
MEQNLSSAQKKHYNEKAIQSMSQRRQQIVTAPISAPMPLSAPKPVKSSSSMAFGEMHDSEKKLELLDERISQEQEESESAIQETVKQVNTTQATPQSIGLDAYGNQASEEFDLGQDGAFSDYSVLVGIFYHEVASCWNKNAGAALKKKGFRVTITTSETEFVNYLNKLEHDVAWIVPDCKWHDSNEAEFSKAVETFHRDKRGLFIFSDNDNYYIQANAVLPKICGFKVKGCNGARNIIALYRN